MKKIGSGFSVRSRARHVGLFGGLLAAGVASAGCYPTVGAAPGPLSATAVTAATTRWPGATAGSLAAGRDLFIAKCNACHGYPDLVAIAGERWPHIVDRMGDKAHLGVQQKEEVLRFVLAARAERAPR